MEKLKIEIGKFEKIKESTGMNFQELCNESIGAYSEIYNLFDKFEKINNFSFITYEKISKKVGDNLIDLYWDIVEKVKIIPQPKFILDLREDFFKQNNLKDKHIVVIDTDKIDMNNPKMKKYMILSNITSNQINKYKNGLECINIIFTDLKENHETELKENNSYSFIELACKATTINEDSLGFVNSSKC